MITVNVGGVDISYDENFSGANTVSNILTGFDKFSNAGFAGLRTRPGPGLTLVFDRADFKSVAGYELSGNFTGMTSNWYHGVKYDVPRVIIADAAGQNNAAYTLIHELTHYYYEADNESREPHSVDFYLAYAEVLKGMGFQQDAWNGLNAYDFKGGPFPASGDIKGGSQFEAAVLLDDISPSQLKDLVRILGVAQSGELINNMADHFKSLGRPDAAAKLVNDFQEADGQCFPAHTRIQTSPTTTAAISDLRVGDIVMAFDPRADNGRGALVPKRVKRLYRNTTTEWIRLRWFDGEERTLITTPGHHFLDQFGQFPTIEEMVRNGRTTVVLASGALAEVTAERITYSAETAHMFERASSRGMVATRVGTIGWANSPRPLQ